MLASDSGMIKIPFKNGEISTYSQVAYSISNKKEIERLEELMPLIDYVNNTF